MALFRRPLAIAILAACSPMAALAAVPFPLTSTRVELPNSERALPPGPGVDVVSANCLTCHSAGMVTTQPPMKKATWEGEVQKMMKVYKAPIADTDVATIVEYLVAIKGVN
jgi:cytochrome c5